VLLAAGNRSGKCVERGTGEERTHRREAFGDVVGRQFVEGQVEYGVRLKLRDGNVLH
jgi:hypothetical protein